MLVHRSLNTQQCRAGMGNEVQTAEWRTKQSYPARQTKLVRFWLANRMWRLNASTHAHMHRELFWECYIRPAEKQGEEVLPVTSAPIVCVRASKRACVRASEFACVRSCVRSCVRACPRACVRAHVRAHVCACMRVRVCTRAHTCMITCPPIMCKQSLHAYPYARERCCCSGNTVECVLYHCMPMSNSDRLCCQHFPQATHDASD